MLPPLYTLSRGLSIFSAGAMKITVKTVDSATAELEVTGEVSTLLSNKMAAGGGPAMSFSLSLLHR